MDTHTIHMDLKKLHDSGKDEASLVIRLILACNDITLANSCMAYFKKGDVKATQKHVAKGGALYFVRLQCGHLHEVMFLIAELDKLFSAKDNNLIKDIFDQCTQESKEDFFKLQNCLEGHPNRQEFLNKIEKLRHKTVFHYKDTKLFKKALKTQSDNEDSRYTSMIWSNDVSRIRFNAADEIVFTIISRFFWKINSTDNFKDQLDIASDFGSDLCKSFVYFSLEYISRYIQAHAEKS